MTTLSVRIISGILSFVMSIAPFGTGSAAGSGVGVDAGGKKTVYVSVDGSDKADGSKRSPFGSIDDARDALRGIDKSKYSGIDVIIGAGVYQTDGTVVFTKEDSGTETCRVRYIAEDGAVVSGGVTLSSDDFSKADGDTVQYFPDGVKDALVMVDLKKYGFSEDDAQSMAERKVGGNPVYLWTDKGEMTLARYPNDDYAYVGEGSFVNSGKGLEWADLGVDHYTIFFDRDHIYSARYWHDLPSVYMVARYSSMDYADDDRVSGFNIAKSSMEVLFTKRVNPKVGMPFFWYNIPEELDVSGEYYIDENCVLCLCPTDDFETTEYTVPLLDEDIISLDGAEYIDFCGITFTGTRRNAVSGSCSDVTFDGCTVSDASLDGIVLTGGNITVRNCDIHNIGETAVSLTGGDEMDLVRSDNVIENNSIYNWACGYGIGETAIFVRGCGATVAHNECTDSLSAAIDYGGPYHTIEYNYCADTCRFAGICGVIGSTETFCDGTVIRYNYIKDSGFTRDTAIDNVGVAGISLGGGQQGVTVYGNVIENVMGDGIGIYGGRENEVYGNIMMQCKYGIHYDGCFVIQAYNCDPIGCNRIGRSDKHVTDADWREAFPYLTKYTYYNYGMDYDNECLTTADFNAAPVSKIYSNVYYLDKAVQERADHPFYTDEYVTRYSGDGVEIPSVAGGTLYSYSSKRTTYDMSECIEANEDKLAITAEQFVEIGKVE